MNKRIMLFYYLKMGGKIKNLDLSKVSFEDYFIGEFKPNSGKGEIKSIKKGKGYSVPRFDVVMTDGKKYQPEEDTIYVEVDMILSEKYKK